MPKPALYALGIVAIGAIVYGISKGAQAWQVSSAVSRCGQLQEQRAQMAVAGADPNDLARIDAQIRACNQSAAALGANVDLSTATLNGCAAKANSRRSQVNDLVGTSYSDPVKRNNQFNNVQRLGLEMVQCFRAAIDDAESEAGLQAIRTSIIREREYSEALTHHWGDRDAGYDRSGDIEPEGFAKATAEINNVLNPLKALVHDLDAKRDVIRARVAGRTMPETT